MKHEFALWWHVDLNQKTIWPLICLYQKAKNSERFLNETSLGYFLFTDRRHIVDNFVQITRQSGNMAGALILMMSHCLPVCQPFSMLRSTCTTNQGISFKITYQPKIISPTLTKCYPR